LTVEQTSTTAFTTATNAACGAAMTSFLSTVIATCPNAQIVVVGYFPILSSSSDLLLISLIVAVLVNPFPQQELALPWAH
jgi:hypothetical protein